MIPFASFALTLALIAAPAGSACSASATASVAKPRDLVDVAAAAGSFETLLTAVRAAGLEDVLRGEGPFTVFAPTDEAFAKVPQEVLSSLLEQPQELAKVLTYHVAPGRLDAAHVVGRDFVATVQGQELYVQADEDGVRIDGARVVTTDIEASNGIIHVIDTVILPRKDIVDTAAEAGKFGTLVQAVRAAGLVETLRGDGPFTVFAPVDDAFAAIPSEKLEALLADEEALGSVLTYHVVPSRILAADVQPGHEAKTIVVKTVQGGELRIEIQEDGSIRVNDANVVMRDVLTSNGVIHVVDRVLVPAEA